MKRPEGFDPPGSAQPGGRKPSGPPAKKPTPQPRPRAGQPPQAQPARVNPADVGRAGVGPAAVRPARVRPAPISRQSRQPKPDAAAKADLRQAARERRRFERAEVRRFTRRARTRRLAVAVVAGIVATLIGLVLLAVYSPILALRTITVDGTNRVDPTQVRAAVTGQLGTPLALINYESITDELAAFPLIRSYVTQIVPPDTLIIHIVERQPVGTIQTGTTFELVDPAGIVVQQSTERLPGVPFLDLGAAGTSSPAFGSMVEVLLALPPTLLAQVDSVSASTQDDVSLVLVGVGQGVKWGSADDSVAKARLLAALIAVTNPGQPGTFDVSAPGNGVFHPN